jgi:hypothetical protein
VGSTARALRERAPLTSREWSARMKLYLAVCALLLSDFSFASSLTGAITTSRSAVDLERAGTLDWARWPGYAHKAGLISDLTITGRVQTIDSDSRLIGDRSSLRLTGIGSNVELTSNASTAERVLRLYLGGWNSWARVAASLPGAAPYVASVGARGNYSPVLTIRFRADSEEDVLRVSYRQTAGAAGTIRIQAAALEGGADAPALPPEPTPVVGSALLTWIAPTHNVDGSSLADLDGYNVYWGAAPDALSNSLRVGRETLSHTLEGLDSGQWYFVVTALAASGLAGLPSNIASKRVP